MTTLRAHLDDLATQFANGVLAAIRGASIEELLAESGGGRRAAPASGSLRGAAGGSVRGSSGRRRGGRLARRSAADIAGVVDRIVTLVKQSSSGLRAEEIRQKLGMEAKEMPRPLKEAVAAGRLSKAGHKRATTYSAKGGSAAGRGAAQRGGGARRVARKARKK